MEMKIPMIAISVFVGIVVLAGVLMPVLNDATATEDTLQNDGYFRMTKITADDPTEYTLNWVKSTDTFTLNGVEVNIGDHKQYTSALGVSVAMTDNSVSRYNSPLRVQSWLAGVSGSIGYTTTTTEINFSNGVQTITIDKGLETESSKSTSYSVAYFISNDGSYVMKKPTNTAYVLADSEVFAVGRTAINTSSDPVQATLKMTGDASDVEFSAITGLSSTPTFSDVTITKSESKGYNDLYDLDKVTATVTYDDTDTAITYSFFVVPYEVTAERSVHFDDNEIAIFAAIPIMVIVALLITVVALVFRGRNF